jgi:hypothetical protein
MDVKTQASNSAKQTPVWAKKCDEETITLLQSASKKQMAVFNWLTIIIATSGDNK